MEPLVVVTNGIAPVIDYTVPVIVLMLSMLAMIIYGIVHVITKNNNRGGDPA